MVPFPMSPTPSAFSDALRLGVTWRPCANTGGGWCASIWRRHPPRTGGLARGGRSRHGKRKIEEYIHACEPIHPPRGRRLGGDGARGDVCGLDHRRVARVSSLPMACICPASPKAAGIRRGREPCGRREPGDGSQKCPSPMAGEYAGSGTLPYHALAAAALQCLKNRPVPVMGSGRTAADREGALHA
jgi:hypothetical protein